MVGSYKQVLAFLKDVVSCLDDKPLFVYTNPETLDWVKKGRYYFALSQMATSGEYNVSNKASVTFSVNALLLKTVDERIDTSTGELEDVDEEMHSRAMEFFNKLRHNATNNAVSEETIGFESFDTTPLRAVYSDVAYGVEISFSLVVPDGYCFC